MDLNPINWLNVLWGVVGGILLTLATMSLVLATRKQERFSRGHLLLAVLAVASAGNAAFEMLMANAGTPDQFGALLQAAHIPITMLVIAIPWFVLVMFRAGRPWLAVLANVLWGTAAAINFTLPHSRLYREITHLERVPLLGGAEFTWVSGTTHPAAYLGYLGVFATLVFVVDAAISLWRRDERRRAIIVGACLGTSLAIGLFHSILVESGALRSPYLVSLGFLIIMVAMASELIRAASSAPALERKVQVQQAEVAHLSKTTMLGQVSGGIAHELSQPLNAILNNAESAISFLDRDPPDLTEVRDALAEIAEQDRHACEVVGGFARLVRQGDWKSELVDVNGVVGEVLELAQKDLDRMGIAVSVEPDPGNPRVRGDPVLVAVIVFNLIRNAIEAMSSGEAAERSLTLATRGGDRGVEVVVTDRGPGIPETDRERVFDPFFTTREGGSGLGLAVSRTLAELYGGRIVATAGPDGRGTSMRLSLPSA